MWITNTLYTVSYESIIDNLNHMSLVTKRVREARIFLQSLAAVLKYMKGGNIPDGC